MSSVRMPGSVYQRPSGRWAAVTPALFDRQSGRRRRISLGTHETRQDALEALAAFQADRKTSHLGRQRLGHYLDRWLELVESQVEVGHLARRTASGYREAVHLHIVPALGHLRLDELNHLVVHDWLTSLRRVKGLSDQTVVRLYRTLHRAMADAPVDRNPVRLPKHMRPVVRSKKRIVRPTAEEIREYLTHTESCGRSEYMYPAFRLAALSGMRRGELIGLAWPGVDLDGSRIGVLRSLGIDAGEVFVKAPKSEAGKRLVGLDPETHQCYPIASSTAR